MWWGLSGCASTDLAPISKGESFQLEEDEKRMWNQVREQEQEWDHSGHLYDNPAFSAYVNQVAQRLVPEQARWKGLFVKVRVVRDPLLNAFAYPNGGIYVHTGILSKMENEAQLATLLGHEMTHFINRHTLQAIRSTQNTSATLASLQVLFAPFGVYGDVASLLGVIGATAAVTGYSRGLEAEADRVGLSLMVQAGYDPREAPKLFAHMKKDLEEEQIEEPYFFGTHPRLEDRIESYTGLIEDSYPDQEGDKGEERFAEQIGPVMIENAKLDLAMGRFTSAQRGLERLLRRDSRHANGHYLLGEIYRQRGQEGDLDRALQEYAQAASHAPSFPEPYRGLGVVYYKTGQKTKAKTELQRYLELAPDAHDRKYIEQYLEALQ